MMRLTTVLALLCLSHCALCAPTVNLKPDTADEDGSKQEPSDTLVLQLEGVPHHRPMKPQLHNEAETEEDNSVSENNGGPEVKRSERVDVDDGSVSDEDQLTENLEAADQDVKDVIRTFFQNLKQHPEIVEDILEREGAKLMNQPLLADEVAGDGVVPLDLSDFQQPSPQLMKSPKQVEKKTSAFPEYPRFIYKSPMRDMKERDEMTAGSRNNQNPSEPIQDNEVNPDNTIVDQTSDVKDLSNAIPVIHQPASGSLSHEQDNVILTNPAEGGAIDLEELQSAQDEYEREHPEDAFMNNLPLFTDHSDENKGENTKSEEESTEQSEESHEKEEDNSQETETNADKTEIVNTNTDADNAQMEETADKRSEESVESNEEKENESKTKETVPHQMTGSEIAAETLNHPVESESSVTFRPYSYYYDYPDGDAEEDGGELDAAEEGDEEDDEDQLEKISSESEEDEEDDEDEEEVDENEENEVENENDENSEETDEKSEETDESEVETDDTEEIDDEDGDEEDEEEGDESETESNIEESEEETDEDTDSESETDSSEDSVKSGENTNSNQAEVEEKIILPDLNRPGPSRLFKSKNLMTDKNEADLMSLHGDEPRQTANRPIAGPPM